MTENKVIYAKWEKVSNEINFIGKDPIYMTDEELAIKHEILKSQNEPADPYEQIKKLIQELQQILKQTQLRVNQPN